MKKYSSVCVAVVLMLAMFAGCGNKSEVQSKSEEVQSVASQPSSLSEAASFAEQEFGYADTLNYDDNTDKEYVGTWKFSSGEAVFVLKEDGSCGFFKSIDDLENDYYWGSHIGALQGESALADLGVEGDERNREPYEDPSKTYSLRLWYDTLYSEGIDKSEMVEGKFDWYMFGQFSSGRVVFVNMKTYTVIDVEKIDLDIEEPVR
ncbi:MAG: hypothetical protein ACK5JF_00950 [Oscillospiraceae bacterium]